MACLPFTKNSQQGRIRIDYLFADEEVIGRVLKYIIWLWSNIGHDTNNYHIRTSTGCVWDCNRLGTYITMAYTRVNRSLTRWFRWFCETPRDWLNKTQGVDTASSRKQFWEKGRYEARGLTCIIRALVIFLNTILCTYI